MFSSKILIIGIILIALGGFFFVTQQKDTTPADNLQYSVDYQRAYVAGGCFWCVEADMEKLEGVQEAISGYMGGRQEHPTYENHADHREAVEVIYNADVVSYQEIIEYFFAHHDPTDEGGSFYDRGHAYTSAVYPQTDEEEQIVQDIMAQLEADSIFPAPIVTAVERNAQFWPAEVYHQDYYKKNPIRYKGYRYASGRDAYLESIWSSPLLNVQKVSVEDSDHQWSNFKKPDDAVLREMLSPLAYNVTQRDKTEAPKTEGSYDDNYEAGIYVDVVSKEPLFSSRDKFDSGTGWPSFTQPIANEFIVTKKDYKLIFPRTEVRSRYADSHLGHVFTDGPEPTGERWCMNGAALDFIPLAEMEERGYGEYIGEVE